VGNFVEAASKRPKVRWIRDPTGGELTFGANVMGVGSFPPAASARIQYYPEQSALRNASSVITSPH
jgi:hypothetical protein